jgi:uncharacterized protein
MITRRHFLRAALAAGACGLGLGLYAWQIEPHWLQMVTRPLPIRKLPAALQGQRLVQLSDIHAGSRVADSYILETFRRVRELAPDIVVYTGDLISYDADIFSRAERVYADLPRGRLATVGILGNHDYGPGWSHPEVAARLASQFRALGVQILRNEVTEVAGLQIAGLDDLWANQFDVARGLAALDHSRPAIVLSHNPDTVDRPGWNDYRGWILSGHTHGGQCRPPFLPPPLLPVQNLRYTAGAFALSGERRLYISRGVGHLLQARFNVRPEVTLFTMVTA